MVERRQPILVSEAVSRVMNYAKLGEKERVSLTEAAGRYLAEDLIAAHDVPAFDRSPYDGFALRSVDTQGARFDHPITLEVVGAIGAGFVHKDTVEAMQAVRVMTGAALPSGCDCVVKFELTEESVDNGKDLITIKKPFETGENVSFQGEDTKKGTILAKKGTYINPGISALLATFGYSEVKVAKKPLIGVIATGSELLEVDQPLEDGKIRNSNAYMIMAQIERAGGEVIYFGQFSDDFDTCFNAVKEGLAQVDFLITTGGVSVGDFDYLPAIYEKLGATVLFNKVAMRPGSVTTVASFNDQLLFGLSGNPSACYVGFELFTRPVIQTFLYNGTPHLKHIKALLGEDFEKANPFTRFIRGQLDYDVEGRCIVTPSGFNKSNAVTSLAETNVLIVIPAKTKNNERGSVVDALLVEEVQGSEWPWDKVVLSYR
ncbi:molybdopterin molybdotransferase [Pullulanibacillus pueri]|uniref:Molybdopterin molybdenumtransferase n=1 Tax=Pullulanibacillus pueri TaxID=1437324 RepID=A0A8J3EP81_9BACL|nr:gephyrin-like molybdotransferase Glp [Pullulanibacillus pueri]MBM7681009.1 molybdopterin molybdotransferase [Pullulanibacillus pueri]GGH86287.1 molybdopterin molybdenumtransferase [Pullulanibacillus pueri]